MPINSIVSQLLAVQTNLSLPPLIKNDMASAVYQLSKLENLDSETSKQLVSLGDSLTKKNEAEAKQSLRNIAEIGMEKGSLRGEEAKGILNALISQPTIRELAKAAFDYLLPREAVGAQANQSEKLVKNLQDPEKLNKILSGISESFQEKLEISFISKAKELEATTPYGQVQSIIGNLVSELVSDSELKLTIADRKAFNKIIQTIDKLYQGSLPKELINLAERRVKVKNTDSEDIELCKELTAILLNWKRQSLSACDAEFGSLSQIKKDLLEPAVLKNGSIDQVSLASDLIQLVRNTPAGSEGKRLSACILNLGIAFTRSEINDFGNFSELLLEVKRLKKGKFRNIGEQAIERVLQEPLLYRTFIQNCVSIPDPQQLGMSSKEFQAQMKEKRLEAYTSILRANIKDSAVKSCVDLLYSTGNGGTQGEAFQRTCNFLYAVATKIPKLSQEQLLQAQTVYQNVIDDNPKFEKFFPDKALVLRVAEARADILEVARLIKEGFEKMPSKSSINLSQQFAILNPEQILAQKDIGIEKVKNLQRKIKTLTIPAITKVLEENGSRTTDKNLFVLKKVFARLADLAPERFQNQISTLIAELGSTLRGISTASLSASDRLRLFEALGVILDDPELSVVLDKYYFRLDLRAAGNDQNRVQKNRDNQVKFFDFSILPIIDSASALASPTLFPELYRLTERLKQSIVVGEALGGFLSDAGTRDFFERIVDRESALSREDFAVIRGMVLQLEKIQVYDTTGFIQFLSTELFACKLNLTTPEIEDLEAFRKEFSKLLAAVSSNGQINSMLAQLQEVKTLDGACEILRALSEKCQIEEVIVADAIEYSFKTPLFQQAFFSLIGQASIFEKNFKQLFNDLNQKYDSAILEKLEERLPGNRSLRAADIRDLQVFLDKETGELTEDDRAACIELFEALATQEAFRVFRPFISRELEPFRNETPQSIEGLKFALNEEFLPELRELVRSSEIDFLAISDQIENIDNILAEGQSFSNLKESINSLLVFSKKLYFKERFAFQDVINRVKDDPRFSLIFKGLECNAPSREESVEACRRVLNSLSNLTDTNVASVIFSDALKTLIRSLELREENPNFVFNNLQQNINKIQSLCTDSSKKISYAEQMLFKNLLNIVVQDPILSQLVQVNDQLAPFKLQERDAHRYRVEAIKSNPFLTTLFEMIKGDPTMMRTVRPFLDRGSELIANQEPGEFHRNYAPLFAAIIATDQGERLLSRAIDASAEWMTQVIWDRLRKDPYVGQALVGGTGPIGINFISAQLIETGGNTKTIAFDRNFRPGGQFAQALRAVFSLNSRTQPDDNSNRNLPGEGNTLNPLTKSPLQQADVSGLMYGDNYQFGAVAAIDALLSTQLLTGIEVGYARRDTAGDSLYTLELTNRRTGERISIKTDRIPTTPGVGEADSKVGKGDETSERVRLDQQGLPPEMRVLWNGPDYINYLGDATNPFPLQGKQTAIIIGDGDSSLVSWGTSVGAEQKQGKTVAGLDRFENITLVGFDFKTRREALDRQVIYNGSEQQPIRPRYVLVTNTLPRPDEAPDGTNPDPEDNYFFQAQVDEGYATRYEFGEDGRPVVIVKDKDGTGAERRYAGANVIVDNTGFKPDPLKIFKYLNGKVLSEEEMESRAAELITTEGAMITYLDERDRTQPRRATVEKVFDQGMGSVRVLFRLEYPDGSVALQGEELFSKSDRIMKGRQWFASAREKTVELPGKLPQLIDVVDGNAPVTEYSLGTRLGEEEIYFFGASSGARLTKEELSQTPALNRILELNDDNTVAMFLWGPKARGAGVFLARRGYENLRQGVETMSLREKPVKLLGNSDLFDGRINGYEEPINLTVPANLPALRQDEDTSRLIAFVVASSLRKYIFPIELLPRDGELNISITRVRSDQGDSFDIKVGGDGFESNQAKGKVLNQFWQVVAAKLAENQLFLAGIADATDKRTRLDTVKIHLPLRVVKGSAENAQRWVRVDPGLTRVDLKRSGKSADRRSPRTEEVSNG